jgi:hypothetical protein
MSHWEEEPGQSFVGERLIQAFEWFNADQDSSFVQRIAGGEVRVLRVDTPVDHLCARVEFQDCRCVWVRL